MIFGATRERRKTPQRGTFSCTVCESEVLRWSDTYEFSDWLMVTKQPATMQRREARSSAGR